MNKSILPLLVAAATFACAGVRTPGDDGRSSAGVTRAAETHDADSAAYEVLFIDLMSAHHQQAIALTDLAKTKVSRAPLKALAEKVAAGQARELEQMTRHREQHFGGAPLAVHPSLQALAAQDLAKLEATPGGEEFDRHFLDLMILHHRAAVMMASDALDHPLLPGMRALAETMLEEQRTEAKQLLGWRAAWFAEMEI